MIVKTKGTIYEGIHRIAFHYPDDITATLFRKRGNHVVYMSELEGVE